MDSINQAAETVKHMEDDLRQIMGEHTYQTPNR